MFIYRILLIVTAFLLPEVIGAPPTPAPSSNTVITLTDAAVRTSTEFLEDTATSVCIVTPTSTVELTSTTILACPVPTSTIFDSKLETSLPTKIRIATEDESTEVIPASISAEGDTIVGDTIAEYRTTCSTPAPSNINTPTTSIPRLSITRRSDEESCEEEDGTVTQVTVIEYQIVNPTGNSSKETPHNHGIADELNKLEALEEDGMLLPQEEMILASIRSCAARTNKRTDRAVPTGWMKQKRLEDPSRDERKSEIGAESLSDGGPMEEEAEHSSLGDTVDPTEIETLEGLEEDEEILPSEEARLSTLHASAAAETDTERKEEVDVDVSEGSTVETSCDPFDPSTTRTDSASATHRITTVTVGAPKTSQEHDTTTVTILTGFPSEPQTLAVTVTESDVAVESGCLTTRSQSRTVLITATPSETEASEASDDEEAETDEETPKTRKTAKPKATTDNNNETTLLTTTIVTTGGTAPYISETKGLEIVVVQPTPKKGSEVQSSGTVLRIATGVTLLASIGAAVVLAPPSIL